MTRLTPRRPRSASERRDSVQKTSACEAPVATPRKDLAAAVGVDADGDDDGDTDDAPALAGLEVGGVDPEVGPAPLDRPREEGLDALVDLRAQARDLAFGEARAAHRLDQVVDRPGRDAVDVGLPAMVSWPSPLQGWIERCCARWMTAAQS